MADLKLTTDKDLYFSTETSDLTLLEGADAISQNISIRLQFFKGEFFADQRIGLDYFGKILVKNPQMQVVSSILKRTILSTPGINSVNDFILDFNNANRTLSVSFRATTTDGEVINFDSEFILL